MAIISLNEKRTATAPTHTTGREKSYFVADQFPSAFAKITGKIFAWGNSSSSVFGGFGAFWENTDGTLIDLEMQIGNLTPVNERGSRINTSATDNWYDLEIDLQPASDGRLIFYGRKTSVTDHYQSDVSLDDIKLVSTSGTINNFDPSVLVVRTGNKWQRSSTDDDEMQSISSYATAKSTYSSANFNDMGNVSTSNNGSWNFKAGTGGTSSGTGSDNAADNNDSTPYLYWEASTDTSNLGKGSLLRWKNNYSLTTGLEL